MQANELLFRSINTLQFRCPHCLAWHRETVFAFPPIIERLSQLLLDVRHVESVLLLHFIRVLGETKALRRWPRFPRAGS